MATYEAPVKLGDGWWSWLHQNRCSHKEKGDEKPQPPRVHCRVWVFKIKTNKVKYFLYLLYSYRKQWRFRWYGGSSYIQPNSSSNTDPRPGTMKQTFGFWPTRTRGVVKGLSGYHGNALMLGTRWGDGCSGPDRTPHYEPMGSPVCLSVCLSVSRPTNTPSWRNSAPPPHRPLSPVCPQIASVCVTQTIMRSHTTNSTSMLIDGTSGAVISSECLMAALQAQVRGQPMHE